MLPDMGQTLKIKKSGRALWITPVKEINVDCANVLSMNVTDQVGDNPSLPVILDLSKVKHVNSSVIGILVGVLKLYRENKLDIFFLKPTPFVLDIFAQCGLSKIADFYESIEDLPQSLQPQASS